MDLLEALFYWGSIFFKRIVGIITKPYETYRLLTEHASWWEVFYIVMVLFVYFACAAFIKVDALRIFLLTKQFVFLVSAALCTYVLVPSLLRTFGNMLGGKGETKQLFVSWAYTLVPTIIWFFVTSLLYIILPPPRTTSVAGMTFSVVYLIFSATMFFWKLTLAYLTLRLGLRLTLGKIMIIFCLMVPILSLYSYGMYMLGIFRVPFI